jgi:hypothetical protein
MTTNAQNHAGALMTWLGRRSGREIGLLWFVWVVLLVYVLGTRVVWEPIQDLGRERIRLEASQVSIDNLQQLLLRRDEIMTEAEVLVDDYLQAQELEASTLVLQRIDRDRGAKTELQSIYPVGANAQGQATRFRTNLLGPPGELGRLFFALGEGAPPIVLEDLALSTDRRSGDRLSTTAILEVEEKAFPSDWLRLFAHWAEQEPGSQDDTSDPTGSTQSSGQRRAESTKPYPYQAIDRTGVFRNMGPVDRGQRLGAAAPTIQSLLQDLTLVGVIWEEDEPVAIIQEVGTGQTHYRKMGQFIGELEIVEITRSAATLRYKDEEGRLE